MSDLGMFGVISLCISMVFYIMNRKITYILAAIFGAISMVLSILSLINSFGR